MADKIRLRMRLHWALQEVLEVEAAWQGIRLGTLVNRCLHEELAKVRQAGLENCLFEDTRECDSREGEIEKDPGSFYLLPPLELRKQYIPTHSRSLDAKGQVSIFLEPDEEQILRAMVEKERLRDTEYVFSYRYILVGLLLNSPVCEELRG